MSIFMNSVHHNSFDSFLIPCLLLHTFVWNPIVYKCVYKGITGGSWNLISGSSFWCCNSCDSVDVVGYFSSDHKRYRTRKTSKHTNKSTSFVSIQFSFWNRIAWLCIILPTTQNYIVCPLPKLRAYILELLNFRTDLIEIRIAFAFYTLALHNKE